jgi:formylglycine-generating enzyme required for sulfatase activity
VQEYLTKLNARNDGFRYRLPTEAEWEYAARAGADAPYSGALNDVAWYAANSEDETHPVGQKKPNAWGLYDVQGNVREWVSDLYSPNYYSVSAAADPAGPTPAEYGRGRPELQPPGAAGFPGGPGRGPIGPPGPIPLPPGATEQQQIDALRQEVAQLRAEIQQLRDGKGKGKGGFGGPGGAAPQPVPGVTPDQLYDTLDGLPTGLPVVRGGGWDQSAGFQRVSARYTYYGPTLRVSDIGFRVVRERAQ